MFHESKQNDFIPNLNGDLLIQVNDLTRLMQQVDGNKHEIEEEYMAYNIDIKSLQTCFNDFNDLFSRLKRISGQSNYKKIHSTWNVEILNKLKVFFDDNKQVIKVFAIISDKVRNVKCLCKKLESYKEEMVKKKKSLEKLTTKINDQSDKLKMTNWIEKNFYHYN